MSAPELTDLEQHEVQLAAHQLTDFRAVNLFRMVADRVTPGSVVDVGCGGGGMVTYLLERGFDARGVDISPNTAKAAQRFLDSRGLDPERITCASLEALIARGESHDNVISMDCLEHIEDDRKAFGELVDLVRPGGRLILTVPAMMVLFGARDEAMKHFRRYEPDDLRRLAADHPLDIDDLRFWNVLGVAPTYLNQRFRGRAIDEQFRYGRSTVASRILRRTLGSWFRHVENAIRPPVGLTLIMTATRLR